MTEWLVNAPEGFPIFPPCQLVVNAAQIRRYSQVRSSGEVAEPTPALRAVQLLRYPASMLTAGNLTVRSYHTAAILLLATLTANVRKKIKIKKKTLAKVYFPVFTRKVGESPESLGFDLWGPWKSEPGGCWPKWWDSRSNDIATDRLQHWETKTKTGKLVLTDFLLLYN